MLEILAIIFIVREFTKLAEAHHESKLKYGLIGAVSYFIPAVLTSFCMIVFSGLDPESIGTLLFASVTGIVVGALVSLKVVLPRLQENHTPPDRPEGNSLLDEDMWR